MSALRQAWRALCAHPVHTLLLFLVFILIGGTVQIAFLGISVSAQVFQSAEREYPPRISVNAVDELDPADMEAMSRDARFLGVGGQTVFYGTLSDGAECFLEADYNCAMTDLLVRGQAMLTEGTVPGDGVHGVLAEERSGLHVGDSAHITVDGKALSLPVTGLFVMRYPTQYMPDDPELDSFGMPLAADDPRLHFLTDETTLRAAKFFVPGRVSLWLYTRTRAERLEIAEELAAIYPQYKFYGADDIIEERLFRTLEASNTLFYRTLGLLFLISLFMLVLVLVYDFREYKWEDKIFDAIGYTRGQRVGRFLWRTMLPGLVAAVLTGGAAVALRHVLTNLWITRLFYQEVGAADFVVDLSVLVGTAHAEVVPPSPAIHILLAAAFAAVTAATCVLLALSAQRRQPLRKVR